MLISLIQLLLLLSIFQSGQVLNPFINNALGIISSGLRNKVVNN